MVLQFIFLLRDSENDLYNVVNLAPPENFSGANDVISMPCASVLLFGVISLDKIVLCYGLLSLLFGGFSSKVEEF